VGGAANKNDRKFLGFAPRELVERGRGASVIRQNPADFAQNSFELRPIYTATLRSGAVYRETERRVACSHAVRTFLSRQNLAAGAGSGIPPLAESAAREDACHAPRRCLSEGPVRLTRTSWNQRSASPT
jgi:hypothetical protein